MHFKSLILFLFLFISGCSFNSVFFPIDERPDEPIDGIFETIKLKAADNTSINHYLFKPAQEHKATILAFQGSGSKVVNWFKVVKPFVEDGYQVFMMDYRGFGESKGGASHSTVAQDASDALTFLANRQDVKGKPLYVLGQSYGGQLAIYVAHKHSALIDALIIEGTFSSFSDEAAYSSPFFVRPLVKVIFSEPYVSKELIAEIDKPALIIHSRDDKVVPFSMAQTLFNNAKGVKKLWEIEGKHVDALIEMPNQYLSTVGEFVNQSRK